MRQPHFSVVAQANTTIELVQAGSVIGSTFTATGGSILVMPSSPLADGTYMFQTQAVDVAGITC